MNHKNVQWAITCHQAGRVSRLHTVPHLQHYNNGQHCYMVTVIVYELAKANDLSSDTTMRLMQAALAHDAPEAITGDIPAPIKRESGELKRALDFLEEEWFVANCPDDWLDSLANKFPERDYALLKAADSIELLMFCVEERALGNTNIAGVYGRALEYVLQSIDDFPKLRGIPELLQAIQTRWKQLSL